MMIESPVAMEHDAILRLRLVIAGDKFDVEARVAECSPLPSRPGAWGVGLEFARLPEVALEKLRAALAFVSAD
jgi:Tfp pilus assembly protein PilZ